MDFRLNSLGHNFVETYISFEINDRYHLMHPDDIDPDIGDSTH